MTSPTLAHADAAARLRVAIVRVSRHLRQTTAGDLTLSQWSALGTIETRGPIRIGDLADREGVSAATATRLVAALEQQRLVARTADPSDGRSWRVSPTPPGGAKSGGAVRAAPRGGAPGWWPLLQALWPALPSPL